MWSSSASAPRATKHMPKCSKATSLTITVIVLMCLGNLHQQNYMIHNTNSSINNTGMIKVKDASSSSVGGPVPKEAAKKEEGLSSSPHKKFSVAKFQFPSVQQRLQYYMGDWYNRSDWTVHDSDCKALREVTDIMLRTTDIKECINISKYHSYCKDAYDAINSALNEEYRNKNHYWVIKFGDGAIDDKSNKKTLPVITKARQSAFIQHAPQPIMWLMNKNRHYKHLERYHDDIVKQGKEIPWSEKVPKVFWRGTVTGNRLDYLRRWISYDDNQMDIAFTGSLRQFTKQFTGSLKPGFKTEYMKSHYLREQQDLVEMNQYKFLLSVEGNDVATGLKWMLYSNSVVFMSPPTVATWAMEDLLIPFVHYIPLANDYSNLLEMIKWANEHDALCWEISQRATEFVEHLWLSEQAKEDTKYLQKALVTSYVDQFDGALSRCAPGTKQVGNELRKVVDVEKQQTARASEYEKQQQHPVHMTANFGIIGFPKTGTTFLLRKLGKHPEVSMPTGETCVVSTFFLNSMSQIDAAQQSKDERTPTTRYGFKCPKMIRETALLEQFAPISNETRLVVGVRHPVLWFESFYNFRVQRYHDKGSVAQIPSPLELTGDNNWLGVSVKSARFDIYLKQLAKVSLTDEDMKGMLNHETMWEKRLSLIPNKVFIYTIDQMSDRNEERRMKWQKDLHTFLQLNAPFDWSMNEERQSSQKKVTFNETINICDEKYSTIRSELTTQGREASTWINEKFISSPDVVVSDVLFFKSVLREWANDPCKGKGRD